MSRNIAILDPQVAAKIAAGEVIERPSAVVRELLDNAIDAGANQISLYLEEGGLQLVRVSDNGLGMSREDLELCYLPHATSKIRQANDLLQLCSLGFRGEALGSIAACSKLRIQSAQEQNQSPDLGQKGKLEVWELRVSDSIFEGLQQSSAAHSGTLIEVRELFYSFPARRKFLKSTRSELASCKSVFQEKALAFPHIHFRLYNNGKMELSLSPSSTLERTCQIFGDLVPEQLFGLSERTEHFSLQCLAAPPALYRRERKRMPIYINQRPIADTSLQQAIRIGYDGYLAGGLFPVCFCFLEVAPDRVDFNIHPAKREARLRDLSLIQATIRQTLRNFCREYGKLDNQGGSAAVQTAQSFRSSLEMDVADGRGATGSDKNISYRLRNSSTKRHPSYSFQPAEQSHASKYSNLGQDFSASFSARELHNSYSPNPSTKQGQRSYPPSGNVFDGDNLCESYLAGSHPDAGQVRPWQADQVQLHNDQKFRYFGQLFEVFLLVEREIEGSKHLLIVDQHASHERILYETLEQEMLQQQPLLVPIELEIEPDEQESLRDRCPTLSAIGIQVEEIKDSWRINSLPPSISDLKEELIELVLHGAGEVEDLKRELFAHLSCRKAIKKGDVLDDISANQLLQTLFSMGLERCPHGRPLWYSLSQQELYRLLQRT